MYGWWPPALLACALAACTDPEPPSWEVVTEEQPGALLSVWGPSADEVWVVGGDALDGSGPMVLRVAGGQVERLDTGETAGDLWWVTGFTGGPIYMGGSGGMILRYQDGAFTRMQTPGTGTVFGLWGSAPDAMWAVGGTSDAGGGFAWRLQGDVWEPEPSLPDSVPNTGALWKIHGIGADDAWLVGSNGLAFHWNGQSLEPGETGVGSSLFTVFGRGDRYAAVGGLVTGIVIENDGDGWVQVTPDPVPESLTGVCLDGDEGGFAVGSYGAVYERGPDGWRYLQLGITVRQNLHAVWVDPDGGVWAAGGNTFGRPVIDGILIHRPAATNE